MNTNNIKTYSSILNDAEKSITEKDRKAFELSYNISERIYNILNKKGMTKKELAIKTGKKESEISRWLSFGHNFTCKTLTLISNALGEEIIQVVK